MVQKVPEDRVRAFLADCPLCSSPLPPILELLALVPVAGASSFRPRDKFLAGKVVDGVRIRRVGEEFKELFFPKTEEDVPDAEVRIWLPTLSPSSRQIHKELGGAAEVYLCHLWELLKRQGDGNTGGGYLRTECCANLAFVRANDSDIATVRMAFVGSTGWDFDATLFDGSPNGWSKTFQIISN